MYYIKRTQPFSSTPGVVHSPPLSLVSAIKEGERERESAREGEKTGGARTDGKRGIKRTLSEGRIERSIAGVSIHFSFGAGTTRYEFSRQRQLCRDYAFSCAASTLKAPEFGPRKRSQREREKNRVKGSQKQVSFVLFFAPNKKVLLLRSAAAAAAE